MNLHSLPQEILARVLNYTDYVAINKIRRMDSNINALAKAYKYGTRLLVNSIWLGTCTAQNGQHILGCTLIIDKSAVDYHAILPTRGDPYVSVTYDNVEKLPLEFLDNLLRHVRLNELLGFQNCEIPFDDEMLAIFWKHRENVLRFVLEAVMSSHIIQFTAVNANVALSESAAIQFISAAKKLRGIRLNNPPTSMDGFLRSSVLKNRKWDSLGIYGGLNYNIHHKHLNDTFLLEVVKNCKNCYINFDDVICTNFTANGAIELFKILPKKRVESWKLYIGFLKSEDPSFNSEEKEIKEFRDITSTFTPYKHLPDDRRYVINKCRILHPAIRSVNMLEFYMYAEEGHNNVDL